jgi:hypothetical protein
LNADELARIVATLDAAVAEAKVYARVRGIDREFREIVRNAREMHDLLLEALTANERLATEYFRGLSDAAANAIDGLEALKRRDRDLLVTAHHEAGHAVIAWVEDIPILDATIVGDAWGHLLKHGRDSPER